MESVSENLKAPVAETTEETPSEDVSIDPHMKEDTSQEILTVIVVEQEAASSNQKISQEAELSAYILVKENDSGPNKEKQAINTKIKQDTQPRSNSVIQYAGSSQSNDEVPKDKIEIPSCSERTDENSLVERFIYEVPIQNDLTLADSNKNKKPALFIEDNGPYIYKVTGPLVTPTILCKNLPEQFNSLPIYGKPAHKNDLPDFYKNKIREFVGYDLNDEEFEKLSQYCSPDNLRTGDEVKMSANFPTHGSFPAFDKMNEKQKIEQAAKIAPNLKLSITKKCRLRNESDIGNHYNIRLKYRGMRMMPLSTVDEDQSSPAVTIGRPLEPGRDLLFRVRLYRPHCHDKKYRYRGGRGRHSVFRCDLVLLGRQKLSALRDRIVCANDVGMRVDVSHHPDDLPTASAREVFPSGFLFINNVFYVDTRGGCSDRSAPLRAWARARGLGDFRCEDLCAVTLEDIAVRLGHPEVYVHQGDCEHLFTFSEIRLFGPNDPQRVSSYPCHTAASCHQTVYCTTCAEFGAKWIVEGCSRVPFDPAFFCDTCFRLYLYTKDGKKIGDFKAYLYRGNELNMLKPQG